MWEMAGVGIVIVLVFVFWFRLAAFLIHKMHTSRGINAFWWFLLLLLTLSIFFAPRPSHSSSGESIGGDDDDWGFDDYGDQETDCAQDDWSNDYDMDDD
ncbi:hypothetical protein JWV37_12180 [Sulfurospirillum sp. T05]|uniref:Uncharacterized protein n=1 Tax=Sulfurospirillum tamanense TaxID=2813362 RepID=A0ABS2WVA0_9BACT|nr:hypothetical protein [Sulfurospirillum tamanensis]MBN2965540.1 hypothetical protein [Sulfurospirillum tamanensis]